MDKFIKNLIEGNNFPPKGSVAFTSSDHVRFQIIKIYLAITMEQTED